MRIRSDKMYPVAAGLPKSCFAVRELDDRLIVITRGELGFAYVEPPKRVSQQDVDRVNAAIDVSPPQRAAMVSGSMFGWNTPAADPRFYDLDGSPTPRKQRKERS